MKNFVGIKFLLGTSFEMRDGVYVYVCGAM